MTLAFQELEDAESNSTEGRGTGSGDSTSETPQLMMLEEGGVDELRQRIRKLEKTVWGASAVIAALITIIGIAASLESKEMDYGSNGTTQQEVVLQLPSS